MASILSFLDKGGKARGFLTLYLLNSLKEGPKSGYDILIEIKEKTNGAWMPSKGTVYPLLRHLEKEGFISVKTTGKRSKNIFEITLEGENELLVMINEARKMQGKMMQFRDLISSIFAEICLLRGKTFLLDYKQKRKMNLSRYLNVVFLI